jgi:hypothetical protein
LLSPVRRDVSSCGRRSPAMRAGSSTVSRNNVPARRTGKAGDLIRQGMTSHGSAGVAHACGRRRYRTGCRPVAGLRPHVRNPRRACRAA